MIKKGPIINDKVVVTYICDNCVKEMPGASITVYYPFGHINDSYDMPSHFCSDKCVIEFESKLIKKYGPWKSESKKRREKKVRSSKEWRGEEGSSPKARRVARKTKRKRTNRKNK